MGEVNGAEAIKDVTNDNVKKWFLRQCNMSSRDLTEPTRSAIYNEKFALCSEDPDEAAVRFALSVAESLDNNNALVVIKDKAKCKIVISTLVKKMEPPGLKKRIINDYTF